MISVPNRILAGLAFLAIAGLALFATACGRNFAPPPAPQVTLLKGQVVDDGQTPVAGARVRLVECGLGAETGADGRYEIVDVPNGDYTVRVDAEVEVGGEILVLALQEPDPAQLRGALRELEPHVLRVSGSISGNVSTSDGSSALNAVAYIVGGDRIAVVADDGSFSLERLPPGEWAVGVAKPGYLVSDAVDQRTFEVTSGQQTQTGAIQLAPIPADAVASVSGAVLLSNPGPEKGVEVALEQRFNGVVYRTYTNEAGLFSLGNIPAGFYQLVASHAGYRTVGLANLELRGGDAIELEQTLILPKDNREDTEYPWNDDPTGNLDDDADGVPDLDDNCPVVPNPGQTDADRDGVGDACDADYVDLPDPNDLDGDGVPQSEDNCPGVVNPGQENADDDPLGDACDPDDDDDGILDMDDACRLIPDPTNSPELCNWGSRYLVYSAQTPTGDITLRRISASQDGFDEQAWDTGPGEAWGAAVSDDGLVFYHQRPDPASPFRLCMVPLANTDAAPRCWRSGNWDDGGDVMNPSVCFDGRTGQQWLFYERQTPGLGWRIWATPVTDVISLDPGAELNLLALHSPPYAARAIVNVRDPACRYNVQTGMELAYAIDFRNSAGAPDGTLDWNVWYAVIDNGVAQFANPLSDYYMSGGPIVHERRPTPGQSGYWYLDMVSGQRTDIGEAFGEMVAEPLIADGANNMAPAYVEINPGPDAPKSLLAYQSDVGGTFDIYLYAPMSAVAVQVTKVDGWAGSPTWSK